MVVCDAGDGARGGACRGDGEAGGVDGGGVQASGDSEPVVGLRRAGTGASPPALRRPVLALLAHRPRPVPAAPVLPLHGPRGKPKD